MWYIVIIVVLAVLLNSGSPIFGAAVGIVIGLLFTYRRGWNARGDYDAAEAHRVIDEKNQKGRM